MSKHTPGPWKQFAPDIINHGVDENYRTIVAGDGFYNDEALPRGFGLTGYINPADARLIAAAPEMYEALDLIMSAYGHIFPVERAKEFASVLAKSRGEIPE